jgi:esterase
MAPLELATTAYGSDGPPLLILHGLFGSARNWASIAQRLAASHRVLALDARNHGASPWAETMSYAEMVEDTASVVRSRDLAPSDVIGHSMGGKIAMLYALTRPREIGRLIVVDVAPVGYPPVLAGYARAMRTLDLAGLTRRAEANARLAPAIADSEDRAFLLQNLVIDEAGAHWRLNLPVIEDAMPEISGFPELPADLSYDGPTLFVAGERSSYVGREHRPAIERLFPQAQILRVKDAGHWVHAERPEAFLSVATAFLGQGR